MTGRPVLVANTEPGSSSWAPTTVRAQGRDEKWLENQLAEHPQLLDLDPFRTGVNGKHIVLRQRQLPRHTGGVIKPDLLILSASGHIIIVEVKLHDNPALKGRSVVAQAVEYAAALAQYDQDDMLRLVREVVGDATSWEGAVAHLFPEEPRPRDLAEELLQKARRSALHIVIACDRAPLGLHEMVRAVTNQSALGEYGVQLTEIVPHVSLESLGAILLVPRTFARTEIVARTAITVSYEAGVKPGVEVQVTSQDDVEQATAAARAGNEQQLSQRLRDVIAAWDAFPDRPRSVGTAPNYRQLKVPHWPDKIHYEWLSHGKNGLSVELHVENKKYHGLLPLLEDLARDLSEMFPGIRAESWTYGLRLVHALPSDTEGADGAEQMAALMDATTTRLSDALASIESA